MGDCDYPNGVIQVITFQFLVFVGWFLSLAAIGDCKFVEITLPSNETTSDVGRGVGFVIFENREGNCFYDLGGDLLDLYINDFLGSDWRASRAMGGVAAIMGFVIFLWSLVFICVDNPKVSRYILICFLVAMTILQGLTFLVLNSDFCDTYDCKFSRSAGFSIGALVCFFICAVAVCCMVDPHDDDEPIFVEEAYEETDEKDEPMEEEIIEEDLSEVDLEEDSGGGSAADELDEAVGAAEEEAEQTKKKKWGWMPKFGKK